MQVGTGDGDLAGLHGLTQGFQHLPAKLGKLVQEQHAFVCQTDLARPRVLAAADDGHHRGTVVGAAVGATLGELAAEPAADAGDHAHFQHLGRIERREQADQAGSQHRLAGTGRAGHQQVVVSGSRDLQRPLRGLLALHVTQVGAGCFLLGVGRLGDGQRLQPAGMVEEGQEAGGGHDLDLVLEPGGLLPAGGGADQSELAGGCGHGGRQDARDAAQAAIQGKLAQRQVTLDRVGREHAHDHEQAQGDRQVEVAAFLGDVGRRQVDRDPLGRQGQAHGGKGGAHPLAALGHGLVG